MSDEPQQRVVCPNLSCGVTHWVPKHVYDQAKANAERWVHCPNGHQWHYAESEEDRLKKRVDELQRQLDASRGLVGRLEESALKDYRRIAYWKGIAHRRRK